MRANLALTAYFLRSFAEILDGKLDGKFIFEECWSIKIIAFMEPRITEAIIVLLP